MFLFLIIADILVSKTFNFGTMDFDSTKFFIFILIVSVLEPIISMKIKYIWSADNLKYQVFSYIEIKFPSIH